MAVKAFENNDYPHKKNVTVVLCAEGRSPQAVKVAHDIMERLSGVVSFRILPVIHPDGLPNE